MICSTKCANKECKRKIPKNVKANHFNSMCFKECGCPDYKQKIKLIEVQNV